MQRVLKTHAGTGNHCWTELQEHVAACAKSGAAILLLLAMGGCGAPQAPPQRIILVTIDALSADHLVAYGCPQCVSPFLDEFSRRSVVFDPVLKSCSHPGPSHASLITSLQPAQHNFLINGEHLDNRLLTIAGVLSQQGYRTAVFTLVKSLNGRAAGFNRFGALSRGFER